ncbi:TPA: YjbF family lipoprotein [Vibrio parahaemolyticus]|nr:YjbF family lipoprotein [Vibrio parahaemolyticus]HCG5273760.1 YjbF family lipoprotein [Vibrio parahaemolyticus]HCG5284303.1 YjbF family lipoprotein [Vibrio parahaemolyticus]
MNKPRLSRWLMPLLAVPALGLLQGCTQKFTDVSATVKEAYNNYVDVELSSQEIQDIPYASAYLKIGNQKQVFVVLAFAEDNPITGVTQLKWVSADKSMIVTENGRIIKTIGLPENDLAGLYGDIPDFNITNESEEQSFKLTYDWIPEYRYAFPADIERTYIATEELSTAVYTTSTKLFVEKAYFPTLSSSIENYYWVDNSGNVKKTIQHIGPNMMPIEFTVLKGFASK